MHRISKIFSHSSGRRRSRADASSSPSPSFSSSSSPSRAAKPKRLDRCYAVKNIKYEFAPSAYSLEESERLGSSNLYGGKTSFRVDGTEGEFEIICETFGFSGIEDFAISPEEFEAMKVKSSAPVMFCKEFESVAYQKTEIDCDDGSGGVEVLDVINRKMEGCEISDVVGRRFGESIDLDCIDRCRASALGTSVTELPKRLGNGVRRSSVFRGNGINGIQPTVLLVDKECSPWDTSRGFVMDNDTCVSGFQTGFCLDEDKEGTREVDLNRCEKERDMGIRVAMMEESRVLSETSSFTSNDDDDDSSSTVTEPMSSISSNEKYRYVIEDWQKGELLGRGSFGTVYEGIADGGFFFAVKEVSLLDQGNEGKQCIIQLEQEIALLSQFEHENIVRYYGTKKDDSHLYIFLELVTKGSLLSLYQRYELRGPIAGAYTRQILHGLKYLHDKDVIHRDIKCANILVHTNGLVKLADFGLAKAAKLNDVKSCKGTAFWMAPEVVRSKGYGPAADIWSLGCTVLEMLTRRFPYYEWEYMAALYRIGKGERPEIPDTLSSDARNFILQCLQIDPSLRPTAAQLLDHPFVKRPLASSLGADSPTSFFWQI
ncbi:hypothetical protein ACS0TY_036880 [Phlomoides rotata]